MRLMGISPPPDQRWLVSQNAKNDKRGWFQYKGDSVATSTSCSCSSHNGGFHNSQVLSSSFILLRCIRQIGTFKHRIWRSKAPLHHRRVYPEYNLE